MQWNTAFSLSPSGGDAPSTLDDRIRDLKSAVYERLAKEHVMDLGSGLAGEDGWHKAGTGVAYYQASAPTTLPDGSTPLGSTHAGRLWYNTSTGVFSVWSGSAWVGLGAPIGTVYIRGPNDAAPSTIWPNTTWTDVSSEEAGLFRRVAGGNALAYGGGSQGDQNKSHQHGASTGNDTPDHGHPIKTAGSGSDNGMVWGVSPSYTQLGGANARHTHPISNDGGTEARPVNVTVQKWRRTA